MYFPEFFARIPAIHLVDPLAAMLGAAQGGMLEYRYEDAVKLAGHSCPTVASAYWLTHLALQQLYPQALPVRGGVRVMLAENRTTGVTGVIAQVVTLLTGAADEGGFKGLGGQFRRQGLLSFAEEQPLALRFTRLDTGASVDAEADVARVPQVPEASSLLAHCLAGEAAEDERLAFGRLWQDRVAKLLLEHGDDPAVFIVRPAA